MKRRSTVRFAVFAPLKSIDACPACGVTLPRVRQAEAWVEENLEGGWVAAYRVMARAGRPLVAEIRLFPNHPRKSRGAGRWSQEASAIPSEGIPGRAVRELRLSVPLQHFARFLRTIEKDPKLATQLLKGHGIAPGSEIIKRRPGRAGRSDSFYLLWAVAYVERLASGSRSPVKDLAARPPRTISGYVSKGDVVSEATVRDLIHQARVRGLLTGSPRGRPGGVLTPKARKMLGDSTRSRGRPTKSGRAVKRKAGKGEASSRKR